jgi:hypothetical protein
MTWNDRKVASIVRDLEKLEPGELERRRAELVALLEKHVLETEDLYAQAEELDAKAGEIQSQAEDLRARAEASAAEGARASEEIVLVDAYRQMRAALDAGEISAAAWPGTRSRGRPAGELRELIVEVMRTDEQARWSPRWVHEELTKRRHPVSLGNVQSTMYRLAKEGVLRSPHRGHYTLSSRRRGAAS